MHPKKRSTNPFFWVTNSGRPWPVVLLKKGRFFDAQTGQITIRAFRSGLGWKGWLGVAALSVIGGSVLMIAGNARKVARNEKEGPSYCLHDRHYH